MDICIYYDEKKGEILDILPKNLDAQKKNAIESMWIQYIPRKILLMLSGRENITAPQIKNEIGHSMSTLHDNIKRLEDADLIKTEMVYTQNKQRLINSNILCVTKSPKHKEKIKKFFQGMWVDSSKTQKILDFLNNDPNKYYTPEEISLNTKIPVDDVELLLSNWDSIMTRGVSALTREVPFEKKVMYKGKK
jgi:DNA-binding Lrp family transcriptional regulator